MSELSAGWEMASVSAARVKWRWLLTSTNACKCLNSILFLATILSSRALFKCRIDQSIPFIKPQRPASPQQERCVRPQRKSGRAMCSPGPRVSVWPYSECGRHGHGRQCDGNAAHDVACGARKVELVGPARDPPAARCPLEAREHARIDGNGNRAALAGRQL